MRLPLPPRHAAGLLLLAIVALAPGVASLPLVDPDEGRHAQIAREVADATTWPGRVVPRLEGQPYRDKPILYYWLAGAACAVLGPDPLAVRLPSLLAGVGTVMATATAGALAFGPAAGVLAGVVLLAAPEVAVLARAATLDMLLTFWVTVGVLAGWRWAAHGGTWWLVAAAAAAGMGALAKGLVAPVLVAGTVGIWLAVEGRLDRLRAAPVILAAVTFAAVTGPWAIAAGAYDPGYLRELLLTHHVQRFVGGGPGRLHAASAVTYVPVLLLGFFPWSLLLPATGLATLARSRRGPAARFCATWAGVVLVFFSLSRGKLGTYILPAFPPLALLTACMLAGLLGRQGGASGPRRPGLVAACAGLVAAGVVLVATPAVALAVAARHYGGILVGPARWTLLLVPLGAALVWLAARGRLRPAVALAAATPIAAGVLVPLLAGPVIGELTGSAHIADMVRRRAPDAPVVVYGLAVPSLRFELGRPIVHLDRPKALGRFVAAHPGTVVVTSPRHATTVAAAAPLVPWYAGPRRVVLAAAAPRGDVEGAVPVDDPAAARGGIRDRPGL